MHASLLLAVLVCGEGPRSPDSGMPADERRLALAATPRMRVGEGSTATAVVIGRKKDSLYLLTADHATDGPDTSALTFEFFADTDRAKPNFTLRGAKALLRRPVADFALLEVAVDHKRTVAILQLAAPGTAPKKFPFEGLSLGCSLGASPTSEKEHLLGKRLAVKSENDVAFFWQAEKSQARGRSGGPMLIRAGEVIGICAATSVGKGYYVHTSEIHAALKAEGFDWLWKREPEKLER